MPGEQTTIGTYYFKLKLGGHESAGFFKECTGFADENEVFTHTSADERGEPLVQKFPGQLRWSNIVLKRGVDSNGELWEWRQQVIDGNVDAARKDGTIEVVDFEGTPVLTYSFVRGWPCKYSSPGLNAGGNDILVEEIEIAHEGFKRAP
jgi:phage tail-like protein